MREALADLADAATAARRPALQHQGGPDMRLGDDQRVDVELVVVLGIGYRRFERPLDVAGDPLAAEGEVGERRRHLLAADQLRHQVQLLRRDADHRSAGAGFRIRERPLALDLAHDQLLLAFLSEAWPWKVRVGANSPNLWPTMSSLTSTGTCLLPL